MKETAAVLKQIKINVQLLRFRVKHHFQQIKPLTTIFLDFFLVHPLKEGKEDGHSWWDTETRTSAVRVTMTISIHAINQNRDTGEIQS